MVSAPDIEAAAEVQAASVEAVASAQRARPVAAVAAVASTVVEIRTVAVARSREEDTVAIGFAGDLVTANAILGCPDSGAFGAEFILFGFGRHSPTATPFYVGYIVIGVKDGLVVNGAIIAVCAILGHCIITAVAPFVGAPIVVFFFLGLTPGVVTAILLGLCCAYIAGCPQQAAWQTKIDIFVTVVRVILAISTRNQKTMTAL